MNAARAAVALAIAALACGGVPAAAADMDVRAPGGAYQVRVTSLKEARFRTTIPQQFDFSCGSAATATLLTFQYGHAVSEQDVFVRMYTYGDQARIRKEGFSLLDMRRYLQSQGFEADGFELPLEKLQEEGVPAIVLLNDRGYRHFVVVKGLKNGRVLLGDPARGTRAMPKSRFEALWDNRVLFVIHNRRAQARFNQERDWRTAPPAPLDIGIQRDGLRGIAVPRRGPGDI
ncbi:C39 family peptidase [Pseudoxanthomonas sp. 22568]|uniref:C39 family peptidase n=1 Tax=unclassified Pseudoxanthomonas TaxID=2645906 RepID=UPI00201D3E2D|nr:C39 family peptidase [Pseudoxanthomonas sp. z9]MCL6710853.1 C39 family peptidase [Pseudomonas sp. R2.Fl]